MPHDIITADGQGSSRNCVDRRRPDVSRLRPSQPNMLATPPWNGGRSGSRRCWQLGQPARQSRSGSLPSAERQPIDRIAATNE
jgi:hypothetical protein